MASLEAVGITDAQAEQLLIDAPSGRYGKGIEVLDANLNLIEDISGDLDGGNISRSMRATVHGTCSLTMASDVDYRTQLLRPYQTITAGGITGRWYLGAYVPRKPSTDYGPSTPSNQIAGSDRIYLLNRPVGDAYTLTGGSGILADVRKVIVDAGLAGSTVNLDSTALDKTLPATKTWPLLADTSGSGTATPATIAADAVTDGASNATTWLQIINELLGMINYRGLWCDRMGLFRSGPYQPPSNREPRFAFDYDNLLRTVVNRNRTVTQDFSTVPNKWIFQQQNLVDAAGNPIEPSDGNGEYIVDEHDDPTTPGYRGGVEWPVVIQLDAADQASLVAQGDARVAADKRVTKALAVTTASFPAAWHWDVYKYADIKLGGQLKVEETEWTLDLGSGDGPPADMQRTWEVVT